MADDRPVDLDTLLERGESACLEHRKVWPDCADQHREVVTRGVDELIAEESARNPEFARGVADAERRLDVMASRGVPSDRHSPEPGPVAPESTPEPACPSCGSLRWVSVSLDGGWTRRAQCVPCGAYHPEVIGPGWKSPRFNDSDAVHPDYREST